MPVDSDTQQAIEALSAETEKTITRAIRGLNDSLAGRFQGMETRIGGLENRFDEFKYRTFGPSSRPSAHNPDGDVGAGDAIPIVYANGAVPEVMPEVTTLPPVAMRVTTAEAKLEAVAAAVEEVRALTKKQSDVWGIGLGFVGWLKSAEGRKTALLVMTLATSVFAYFEARSRPAVAPIIVTPAPVVAPAVSQ